MPTVVSRHFICTPGRDANSTWLAIVDLLTRGTKGPKRDELLSVSGIATSTIADQAPREAAITVTCDGPRTRIYCVYDDDAIDGSDCNEDPLGFDPLEGNWQLSLPCLADDLAWVQSALQNHSKRVTARDCNEDVGVTKAEISSPAEPLLLDPKGFFNQ